MSIPSWLVAALTTATVGPLSYTIGERSGRTGGHQESSMVASQLSPACEMELNILWQDHVEAENARGEALDETK